MFKTATRLALVLSVAASLLPGEVGDGQGVPSQYTSDQHPGFLLSNPHLKETPKDTRLLESSYYRTYHRTYYLPR